MTGYRAGIVAFPWLNGELVTSMSDFRNGAKAEAVKRISTGVDDSFKRAGVRLRPDSIQANGDRTKAR